MVANDTMKSEWNFDETIKLTMKGVPVELDLEEMSDDDEEWELRDKEVNIEEGSAWGTTRVRESGVGSTINVSDLQYLSQCLTTVFGNLSAYARARK